MSFLFMAAACDAFLEIALLAIVVVTLAVPSLERFRWPSLAAFMCVTIGLVVANALVAVAVIVAMAVADRTGWTFVRLFAGALILVGPFLAAVGGVAAGLLVASKVGSAPR